MLKTLKLSVSCLVVGLWPKLKHPWEGITSTNLHVFIGNTWVFLGIVFFVQVPCLPYFFQHDYSALELAVTTGNLEIVKIIITHNAKSNHPEVGGKQGGVKVWLQWYYWLFFHTEQTMPDHEALSLTALSGNAKHFFLLVNHGYRIDFCHPLVSLFDSMQ